MKGILFNFLIVFVFACIFCSCQQTPCDLANQNWLRHSQSYTKNYQENQLDLAYLDLIKMNQTSESIKKYCPLSPVDFNSIDYSSINCTDLMKITYEIVVSSNQNMQEFLIKSDIVFDLINFVLGSCTPFDFPMGDNIEQDQLEGDSAMNCAICTFVVTLLENEVNFKRLDIADYLGNQFCKLFQNELQKTCQQFVEFVGPFVIQGILKGQKADKICKQSGLCSGAYETCNLYPVWQPDPSLQFKKLFLKKGNMNQKTLKQQIMEGKFAPWKWIVDLVKRFTDDHLPILDLDNDGFSDIPTFRGYNWRGEDCDDLSKEVYPGRKVWDQDPTSDFNCNGIKGKDVVTGKPWKELLCDGSYQVGVGVMGDSVGARFEIPPDWINVTQWHKGVFSNLFQMASDELDMPYQSASTGYLIKPLVGSLYLKMLQRNRCNRNDYQNIAVNGGSSTNSNKNFHALRRNQTTDFPMIMTFELVGNDVCGKGPGDYTPSDVFEANVLKYWQWLDTVLPKGSHLLVLGLVDGRILYDSMWNLTHPINATYENFYNFLNCLHISPCFGWMNSDEATRNLTTEKAMELNAVYVKLIATNTFQNFDIAYYPLPQQEVLQRALNLGFKPNDIIEPVDGFHPNQLANYLLSDIMFEKLQADHPDWLGPINPYNSLIDALFGVPEELIEKEVFE